MLFFARLGTSIVLFVVLFIVLLIGTLGVGGGIAGARAGAQARQAGRTQSDYEVGQQAGSDFGKRYGKMIMFASLGVAGMASLVISFSGILPWCRKATVPPVVLQPQRETFMQDFPASEPETAVRLKHSGFGIASFISSIILGSLLFVMIVIAAVMQTSTPGGINEKSPVAILLGLFIIVLLLLEFVALGLGIVGLCQKDRKKIFAALGAAFSSVASIGTLLLMIIGSMMK
jgi:hypothetical protein